MDGSRSEAADGLQIRSRRNQGKPVSNCSRLQMTVLICVNWSLIQSTPAWRPLQIVTSEHNEARRNPTNLPQAREVRMRWATIPATQIRQTRCVRACASHVHHSFPPEREESDIPTHARSVALRCIHGILFFRVQASLSTDSRAWADLQRKPQPSQ